MENLNNIIDSVSQNIRETPHGTYKGNDDLLHCKKCNKPVQCKVEFMGRQKTVNCICDCVVAEMKEQQQLEADQEKKKKLAAAKQTGFSDSVMIKWTFANDNGNNAEIMRAMKRYCENFKEFKESGRGLLLYGNVGTGKTYAAAAIANELIESGFNVLMTNFSKIINKLQSTFDGREEYLNRLNDFDLLIIDDLAAERQTEYMQENIYNVIDSRYRSNKPLIITTNLTIDELKNPDNISKARTFDRIIEKCYPVEFKGVSQRRKKITAEYQDVKNKLGL